MPSDSILWVFFFQAGDGIRDYKVTGVQTCALPIYVLTPLRKFDWKTTPELPNMANEQHWSAMGARLSAEAVAATQIGRASCRERVEISVAVTSSHSSTSAC